MTCQTSSRKLITWKSARTSAISFPLLSISARISCASERSIKPRPMKSSITCWLSMDERSGVAWGSVVIRHRDVNDFGGGGQTGEHFAHAVFAECTHAEFAGAPPEVGGG